MKNTIQLDHWRGNFGDAYISRNETEPEQLTARRKMWEQVLSPTVNGKEPESILEVGANIGLNLRALKEVSPAVLYGLEPNPMARQRMVDDGVVPADRAIDGTAQAIPLNDGAVEMSFTCGVMIHIHPEDLAAACKEISRVTKRYIACIEYFDAAPCSIPYRGRDDLLFKRDFGSFWMEQEPTLKLLDYGFFWKPVTTLDNLTWWLFERS